MVIEVLTPDYVLHTSGIMNKGLVVMVFEVLTPM